MGTADMSFGLPTAASAPLKHGRTSSFLRNILHPPERVVQAGLQQFLAQHLWADRRAASSCLCFGATVPVQLPGWLLCVQWPSLLSGAASSGLCPIPEWPWLSCVRGAGVMLCPQLCLCAGSAAGSGPAAVSLCLHPAVTWHRARGLGWKVLVS